jgi:hypothetical protein
MDRPEPKIGGLCRLLHGNKGVCADFVFVDEIGISTNSTAPSKLTRLILIQRGELNRR